MADDVIEWTDRLGRRWFMEDETILQLGRSPRECNAKRVALKRGMVWQWPVPTGRAVGRKVKRVTDQLPRTVCLCGLDCDRLRLDAMMRAGAQSTSLLCDFGGKRPKAVRDERERIAAMRLAGQMAAWWRACCERAEREARRERLRARGFKLA